ncbi:MAG: nuclear transport factor 2 family protein [Bauldia sp.]|nr:nuclear transport factor 2 family protein [Bauldia sp.]
MPTTFARRIRPILFAATVLGVGFAAGWMLRGGSGAAVAEEDATVLAEAQLARFYDAISGKAPLADVLGEAFQIMRTDGTRYDRAAYLERPASYGGYALSGVKGTMAGDVLTTTYFTTATGTVGDQEVVSEGEPRLAVFTRSGGAWALQGLASLGNGFIANPGEAAAKAVEEWVAAAASGDKARLDKVLAPEFQIVRADGSAYDKQTYLAVGLPSYPTPPEVADLDATGYGDLLVVRYLLTTEVDVGGETLKRNAPRLTVFRKAGGGWLVVAHANLAAPEG